MLSGIVFEILVKSNLQVAIITGYLYQWRIIYTNGVGIIYLLQRVINYTIVVFLPL